MKHLLLGLFSLLIGTTSSPVAFLDLSPVGSEGLHTDRPPYLRKWSKLENLVFTKGGSWRSRPGLDRLSGTIPTAIAAGVPSLIMEVPNPRSTTTSGGKIVTFTQTLFPTGNDNSNGFTPIGAATVWEAIDDNPPDNFTTRVGAIAVDDTNFVVTHTSVSTEFENIDAIVIHGRVRLTGTSPPVSFQVGLGTFQSEDLPLPTAFLSETFTISGTTPLDFAAIGTVSRSTGAAFTVSELADNLFLSIGVQNVIGPTIAFDVDYINMTVVGTRTEMAANTGLIGVSKVIVSNRALLEYNDLIPSYIDRRGAAALPSAIPIDAAILYGQIFAVNGEDQTYIFPNSSGNWYQLAGKPTGRTVASFAGRILVGWATSAAGQTIPERVVFSVKGNGEDYTGVGSGLFDCLATPGGIVKLTTFSDDLCMLYKEQGVWTVRRTGDDDIPFIPDVIDFETRCIALKTVKTTLTKEGSPIQFFLGRNALNGLSIFRCDGVTVTDVGQGIQKFLNDSTITNFRRLALAFAEVDPDTGNYWLFIAEGNDAFPKRAWILDMRTYEWTSAALGYQFSTAGRWTLLNAAVTAPTGENQMILGKASDNLAYTPDSALIVDEVTPGLGNDTKETVTWETGDHRLSGTAHEQGIGYRLHMLYTAAASLAVNISASTDGGVTYSTKQFSILNGSSAEPLSYAVLDPLVSHGRRIRFKVEAIPDLRTSTFEISEMWIESESAGVDA